MKDEYTELAEQRRALEKEIERLRGEHKRTDERWHELRDNVVRAQNEQCAYCDVYLISNEAWQMNVAENDYGEEVERSGGKLFMMNPDVPFESRVKYQIRLKIPKSRGGEETIDNLVACCWECGQLKANNTHEEFIVKLKQRRWARAYNHKRMGILLKKYSANP
jgi:5-methylcytosine-specific restriction endonuclease McrA